MSNRYAHAACLMILGASLSACGLGDAASTAAAVGAFKAQEAEEARKAQERVEVKLDAALLAGQERLQEGGAAAR